MIIVREGMLMDLLKSNIILSLIMLTFFLAGCASTPKKADKVRTKQKNHAKAKYVTEVSDISVFDEIGADTAYRDYDKMIAYHLNRLKRNPENHELNYETASLYILKKGFVKSQFYISRALDYAPNESTKAKYQAFYDYLERQFVTFCKRKDSILCFNKFTKLFPESRYKLEVREALLQLEYQEAKRLNSLLLFEEFSKDYPETLYIDEATEKIDELMWEEVVSVNRIERYIQFLRDYPFTDYKQDALDNIDRLRYAHATMLDTTEAYGGFIQEYPVNKYVGDARERIKALKFAKTVTGDSVEGYQKYLESHPSGDFAADSQAMIDKLRFREAKEADSIQALEEYVTAYPKGQNAYRAKRILDLMRYEETEEADNVEEYKKFIEKYPRSHFKRDAEDRINELTRQAKIKRLCDDAEADFEKGELDAALKLFTEALDLYYSSRAHAGAARVYMKKADITDDYNKKIELYYKSITAFKVVLRKDPEYVGIEKEYDNVLSKRAEEKQVMTYARLRKQSVSDDISVKLITYSKRPVIVVNNNSTGSMATVSIKYANEEASKQYSLKPQTEIKEMTDPGSISIEISSVDSKNDFSLELFPYYEYTLRVK